VFPLPATEKPVVFFALIFFLRQNDFTVLSDTPSFLAMVTYPFPSARNLSIFVLSFSVISDSSVHGISGSFSENRPSLHMGNKHQKVKAVFKIFLSSHPNPKNLTPFVKAAQNGSIKISHRLI
jgi:hypothetical protein